VKRKRFWMSLGLVASLALILAACGSAATEGISPVSTPTNEAPSGSATSLPNEAQEITSLVLQDLSERLNTPVDQITVEDVTSVQWPDSSLGCPRPGMRYLQVITPGYQIVLRVDDREYSYHAGSGNFVLCENGEPVMRGGEELDPEEAALVEKAQADLVERLKVAPDSITLRSIEPVQWRDSSLGCPRPGMNYLTVITPGYLIKLEAGGAIYEYHTDQQHVVYCQNPQAPLREEPGSEVDVEARLVDMAKADLAQRTGVSVAQIQTVRVEAVDWPDASLGCPQPGKMYAQVITPGYQIVLSIPDKEYDYHTNLTEVFLCKK
jgi:hypothetical protein